MLSAERFPDQQFVLRLASPKCAAAATPGAFVHLRVDDDIPMRRPLSIMRSDPQAGWIEVLFKVVGDGLRSLGRRRPGDVLSSMGPIGRGFEPHPSRPHAVLIGGGVGIPPMIFLAESMRRREEAWRPVVFMGSEIAFPFELAASRSRVAGVAGDCNRSMALLESLDVPSRLASLSDFAATYRGYVTELTRGHLHALSAEELEATELFACGPTPMLAAAAAVARDFDLPCQVSLEEYMACAVGGCAGCTVRVETADGPAMKRVCVDGPVFDASAVFAAA